MDSENCDISVQSVQAVGNTKTTAIMSPSKRFCFTLNNYTSEECTSVQNKLMLNDIKLAIVGKEIGDSGTPHLQGYFEFETRRRPIQFFGNKRIHFEKCKGSREENIKYCSKDGSIVYTKGCPKPIKILSEFYVFQEKIITLCKEEPDDRSIYWYFDSKGGCGKSKLVKYLCYTFGALICSGKASDMKFSIVKYKEKHGDYPSVIIFDVPRSNIDYISYGGIEEIKNGCFHSSKYECEMVVMNEPHVLIFANEPPEFSKMSRDRWRVFEVIGKDLSVYDDDAIIYEEEQ